MKKKNIRKISIISKHILLLISYQQPFNRSNRFQRGYFACSLANSYNSRFFSFHFCFFSSNILLLSFRSYKIQSILLPLLYCHSIFLFYSFTRIFSCIVTRSFSSVAFVSNPCTGSLHVRKKKRIFAVDSMIL